MSNDEPLRTIDPADAAAALKPRPDMRNLGQAAFEALRQTGHIRSGGELFSAVTGFVVTATTAYPSRDLAPLRDPADDPSLAAEVAFIRNLVRHLSAYADELALPKGPAHAQN